MKDSDDTEWLILLFGARLRLALVRGASPDFFCVDGVEYRDTGRGELTAFYDRLQDGSGRLVGVRVNPVHGAEQFVGRLPSAPYLTRPPGLLAADVSFRPEAARAAVCTGDQAFGGKWFIASGGGVAMSLNFTYLSTGEADRRALLESSAEWATVIL